MVSLEPIPWFVLFLPDGHSSIAGRRPEGSCPITITGSLWLADKRGKEKGKKKKFLKTKALFCVILIMSSKQEI